MTSYTLHAPTPRVVDYAEVVIPFEDLAELEASPGAMDLQFVDTSGRAWPVVVARGKGYTGISVRVLCSFPEPIVRGKFEKAGPEIRRITESQFTGFLRHTSLINLPPLRVVGYEETSSEVVQQSIAEIITRTAYSDGHGSIIVWQRIRHLHPVVDYGIRWYRRSNDGWMPCVRITGAEAVALTPDHRWKDITVRPQSNGFEVQPPAYIDGRCAPTVWVRATYPSVEPEDAISVALRATYSDRWPVGVYDAYKRLNADHPPSEDEQDSVAIDVNGHARWMTLGLLPSQADPERIIRSGITGHSSRSIYDRRVGAQALSANQAGTQRFGCAEGAVLLSYSPLDAYAYLRQMAGDEELRPVHYYEEDGTPLDFAAHRKLRTHNRRIDWRNSEDHLWFEVEPPRVTIASRRTTDDEQHMDDLGIDAFLNVFDDPGLEETRRLMLRLDAMDTQMLNNRINSAARGVGRPLLSFANAAWLFGAQGDPDGALAGALGTLTIAALAENWEGRDVDVDRPIKPVSTLTGVASWLLINPDTQQPMRAAAVYEHASVVAGLLAMCCMLEESEARTLGLAMAKAIGTTILHWKHNHPETGVAEWPFVIGVLEGEQNGDPLPGSWCWPGTKEFSMTHLDGGSWTTWTMPAVMSMLALDHEAVPQDVLRALVEQVVDDGPSRALKARFCAIDPNIAF